MREESKGQEDNRVEMKNITQRQSEDVFPVSCRRSSLAPGVAGWCRETKWVRSWSHAEEMG